MKIVFCKINPPFYENIPHRNSYFTIDEGIVKDDPDTIRKNQHEFFSQYFPTDDEISKFNNNQGYIYTEDETRGIDIQAREYPEGVYPSTFEFWNNVDYVKIIHEGYTEYCFISNRKCTNEKYNHWSYTLQIDIWNTTWADVCKDIFNDKNYNLSLDVVRFHEPRFELIEYENEKYLVFKFLTTQKTSFWNKEKFESQIKSVIQVETNKSLTPWTEYPITNDKIINAAKLLWKGYKNYKLYSENDEPSFFTKSTNGFLSVMLESNNKDIIKPWNNKDKYNNDNSISNYNGMVNCYWIIPLINKDVLVYIGDNKGVINPDFKTLKEMFDYPILEGGSTQDYYWFLNLLENNISSTRTSTIIQTPKPTLLYNTNLKLNDKELNYQDVTYPIRYRDRFKENLNKSIYKSLQEYYKTEIELDIDNEKLKGVTLTNSEFFHTILEKESNFANIKTSLLNSLCDERIPLDKITELLYINPKSQKLIQNVNIELEPKIYDEELTNIIYTHYNQNNYYISPKWYFFNNWDDIFKFKSIFIMGYQFTQPHIVGLIQYVNSGLYNNKNFSAQSAMVSFFSPNQQTSDEAQKQFLISNRSQLNTALNNQKQNSIIGGVSSISSSISGGIVAGAVGGSIGGPVGSIVGGLAGAAAGVANSIFTGIKSANQYSQMKASQEALLNDLANTPNSTTDPLTESSFKLLNSYDGFYIINSPSNIDKEKIWWYHAQNGYLFNSRLNITTDLPNLSPRLYYNTWKINFMKTALQYSNIPLRYKNYYENLFEQGFTLWNYNYFENKKENKITLGYYELENWEVEFWEYISKKEIIINPDNFNTTLEISVSIQIENFDKLSNVRIVNNKKDYIDVELLGPTIIVKPKKIGIAWFSIFCDNCESVEVYGTISE